MGAEGMTLCPLACQAPHMWPWELRDLFQSEAIYVSFSCCCRRTPNEGMYMPTLHNIATYIRWRLCCGRMGAFPSLPLQMKQGKPVSVVSDGLFPRQCAVIGRKGQFRKSINNVCRLYELWTMKGFYCRPLSMWLDGASRESRVFWHWGWMDGWADGL